MISRPVSPRCWWLFLVALHAAAPLVAQEAAAAPKPPVELYDYDASLPLDPELQIQEETDDWTVYHLTYGSAKEGRVPALLGVPRNAEPPHPLVVLQHGLTGHKNGDHTRGLASSLAQAGYATLRIDAQYHGERARQEDKGKFLEIFWALLMDGGWAQTIADQRRGIDYCEGRDDIDCRRVGYIGVSMGAIMGGITCAVEERIDGAVLIIGGAMGPRADEETAAVDPATFIPLMSPRPMLMLNGKNDDLVEPASAKRLFAAAKEPKRIVWYDTGHWVPPDESWLEISAFLAKNVKDAVDGGPGKEE
jgi:dienelactone hydrolase